MKHKTTSAHVAYLMLCTCTAILFASIIILSIVVRLSAKVIPPEASGATTDFADFFQDIILFAFLLSGFALWIFNWLLIAKTWHRRSPLLNAILVFVQIFGTFINFIVCFILFRKHEAFANDAKTADLPAQG